MYITQKEIAEQVERIKARGEGGAKITKNRIASQMEDQRAVIHEARTELRKLEKELTIHLIACDTLKFNS